MLAEGQIIIRLSIFGFPLLPMNTQIFSLYSMTTDRGKTCSGNHSGNN
jgi:hypothetical protein